MGFGFFFLLLNVEVGHEYVKVMNSENRTFNPMSLEKQKLNMNPMPT